MPKDITLVLRGTNIAPEDAIGGLDRAATARGRSTVHPGDGVRFMIGPELTGGSITFEQSSPVGEASVKYGDSLTVSQSAAPGVYRYNCTAFDKDGKEIHSIGGGEMEVISL